MKFLICHLFFPYFLFENLLLKSCFHLERRTAASTNLLFMMEVCLSLSLGFLLKSSAFGFLFVVTRCMTSMSNIKNFMLFGDLRKGDQLKWDQFHATGRSHWRIDKFIDISNGGKRGTWLLNFAGVDFCQWKEDQSTGTRSQNCSKNWKELLMIAMWKMLQILSLHWLSPSYLLVVK